MARSNQVEKILWSVALPGFGQLLNGKMIKGIVLIFLEFLINIKSNLNTVIISSFQGEIQTAIVQTNYQWLLFYPCVYLYAIWDAYRDAGGGVEPFSFLPFVFSAFVGTIGVIYSPTFNIMGVYFGSIWLPILFLIFGFFLGKWIRSYLVTRVEI